jgi:hypothetical protein
VNSAVGTKAHGRLPLTRLHKDIKKKSQREIKEKKALPCLQQNDKRIELTVVEPHSSMGGVSSREGGIPPGVADKTDSSVGSPECVV